jgi:hypothetical protein
LNVLAWAGALKKILLFLWLCALCAPMARGVSAQAGETITLAAQAGFDGMCRNGAWLPVRVTVENTGGDFDARVQASYKNDQGGLSVYAVDISLPATSRKEFFLYIQPTGSVRNFDVSVLDGKTIRAQKKMNISCSGNDTLFFGVLADDPTPYNILNDIHPLNGGRTNLAQLTLSDLPDRAQGWSALDALVISNVDTGKLTADQKQAMQLWLANGGKLFVTGGINWATTSAGLRDVLPIDITSTKKVMGLPALSTYVKDSEPLAYDATLAVGKSREGAQVLVQQYEVPLLIEKQIGYGKVYYFTADPGLQPLNTWDGMKEIYIHLLAFKPRQPVWAQSAWEAYSANNALSALPELELPSFLYICCWLGLYIIAIGPINYLILRRVKRTELAWVTVPVLVILFSCLAYVAGFAYRGVRPILNRLALAQGWDGVSEARVNNLVGVYSPSRTTYNIQTEDQFMLYQPSGMDSDLQGNNDWLLLKNESGTTLPDVRVEIGGMRSIGAEGAMPALNIQHDLILTLTKSDPKLTGTVTNMSDHTLHDAALVTPTDWQLLGDLKPNESQKVSYSFSNAGTMTLDTSTLLSALGMSSYPSSNDKDMVRRSSFFQASVISVNGYVVSNPGVYLMGWVEDAPASVSLQDQKSDSMDTMLYFQKLTPDVAALPQSFILTSSMYNWESSIEAINTYQVPSGGYEIRFQPDLPLNFNKVNSFMLDIQSNTTPDKVQVSLWNFETKTWTPVTLVWTTTIITVPDPDQHVGADGEIRIQLNANQNDYVEIRSVNFTLGVKP